MPSILPAISALALGNYDWSPGALEWFLVFEAVVLATMAGARWVAQMLGRTSPGDPFVIFYRVFWAAMVRPSRHPTPTAYLPVPPRTPRKAVADPADAGGGLTDDELERLMSGDPCDDVPASASAAVEALDRGAKPGPSSLLDQFEDDEDEDAAVADPVPAGNAGGTRQALMAVRLVAGGRSGVIGYDGRALVVGCDVPADDGRANAAATAAAREVLGVASHQVALYEGHARADKLLRVSGLTAAQIVSRLAALPSADAPSAAPEEQALVFRDDD